MMVQKRYLSFCFRSRIYCAVSELNRKKGLLINWRLWERKTFTRHRRVIYCMAVLGLWTGAELNSAEADNELRTGRLVLQFHKETKTWRLSLGLVCDSVRCTRYTLGWRKMEGLCKFEYSISAGMITVRDSKGVGRRLIEQCGFRTSSLRHQAHIIS